MGRSEILTVGLVERRVVGGRGAGCSGFVIAADDGVVGLVGETGGSTGEK